MKSFLLLIIISTFSTASNAQDLLCSLVGQPNTSELKVSYTDNKPSEIFLRSPEETDFRKLDVTIDIVFSKGETGGESEGFNTIPNLKNKINWGNEYNCYKEIGTQRFFIFNFVTDRYLVQLAPYFTKKNDWCMTPRAQPQTSTLNCSPIL